jgi:hypothetical protein
MKAQIAFDRRQRSGSREKRPEQIEEQRIVVRARKLRGSLGDLTCDHVPSCLGAARPA